MTGHYIIALILALFVLGGTTQPCLAARDNTPVKGKQGKIKPLTHIDLKKLWKEAKSISQEKVNPRAKRYMLLISTFAEKDTPGITWQELAQTRQEMSEDNQMELVFMAPQMSLNGTAPKNAHLPVLCSDELSAALSKELKVARRTVVLFNSKGKILKVADLEMLRDWQQCLAPGQKEAEQASPKTNNKIQKPASKLAKVIHKMAFQTKQRPNLQAKHYVFLMSHRSCASCCAEMPNVVREYENMRKDDQIEIILLAGFSPLDAKFYAETYKVPFPVCYSSTPELRNQFEGMRKAAGKEISRISAPHAIFATADGRLLQEGPAGQLIPQWETITNEAE